MALRGGAIAGAELDDSDEEPLPPELQCRSLKAVILAPQTSGFGTRYWERAIVQFSENLRRYVVGELLFNSVHSRSRPGAPPRGERLWGVAGRDRHCYGPHTLFAVRSSGKNPEVSSCDM